MYVNGEWKRGRILNGDEVMMLSLGENLTSLMIELYKF